MFSFSDKYYITLVKVSSDITPGNLVYAIGGSRCIGNFQRIAVQHSGDDLSGFLIQLVNLLRKFIVTSVGIGRNVTVKVVNCLDDLLWL